MRACTLCNLTGWTTAVYRPDGSRVETPCARCNPDSSGRVYRELATDRDAGLRLISTPDPKSDE